MLVLQRKRGESVRIGDIVVRVLDVNDFDVVKIGIDAPRETPIVRDDVVRKTIENVGTER